MNKYVLALARHERARQRVDDLKYQIGDAIRKCPIDIEAHEDYWGDLWTQDRLHTKNHLWQAFQHSEPSDCGYGMQRLSEDGIEDALSPGSEYECEHCLAAWKLIHDRKQARKELGYARLAIRALGKQAMKEIEEC